MKPASTGGRVRHTYTVLVPLLIALFLVSGIGNNKRNHKGFHWDALFWALFGVVFVITVLFSVAVVGKRFLKRAR